MIGRHISLFAGIGCTDLAVEKAGFKTLVTAECEPFARSVLQARFPDAEHLEYVEDVHPIHAQVSRAMRKGSGPLMISGGFPCQDISDSGTGHGLNGTRSGQWSNMAHVIRQFLPEYVLIENSSLLTSRGLHVILHDLTKINYHVRWECIPAAYAAAPHMRDRIWIMAKQWSGSPDPWVDLAVDQTGSYGVRPRKLPRSGVAVGGWTWETRPLTTRREARQGRVLLPTPTKSDGSGGPGTTPKRTGGKNLRTVAWEIEGNGRLTPEYVEWMMGLPGGWTDLDAWTTPHQGWHWMSATGKVFGPGIPMTTAKRLPNRSKRIKALGNGLVPQVAEVALDILLEGQ